MRTPLLLAAALLAACGGDAASDTAAGTSTEVATSADTGATDTGSSTATTTSTGTATDTEGAALYAIHCASCHGADGSGVSAPSLGYNVSGKTDEELRTLIRDGSGYMPPVAVPDEDIPVLIAYLRATFTHGR